MEWVRLLTTYHRDDALANAGEAAEVLFGRALSYCGDQETSGFVSDAAAKRLTPTRTKARTDALVRVELWERDDEAGGWWIRSWDRIQESHDTIAARRKAARDRQRRHRAGRNGSSPPPPSGVPVTRPVTRDGTRDEVSDHALNHDGNGSGNGPGNRSTTGRSAGAGSRAPETESAGQPVSDLRPVTRDVTRDSRDRARANAREELEQDLPVDQLSTPSASVDAHESASERTAAQRLTARYAAGVRLANAGMAIRTLTAALDDDGLPERLLEGAVDVLIAEQGECTRGRLRVALLKAEGNWGPPGSAKPGNPYLDDLRSRGTGTDSFRALFAVPDPNTTPALEAR